MLNKFFTKPLELQIGEQNFKFCSVADFEFAMAGRTSVPSKKITEMVKFSTDQLKKEAKTIKDIEKRFVNILSDSIEDTQSINRALRELDPLIFSSDHNWRDIINALNEGDDDFNSFRRIALVKYMQYLSSRQEIIKYLYTEKKKILKEKSTDEPAEAAPFKDTLLLENTVFEPFADESAGAAAFERMPKGEAVTITLRSNADMEVRISKHSCRIVVADNVVKFIDQEGRTYELEKGRNIVGRDTVSTIMIDPTLRDVSRLHLVIENFDDSTLQLTDLSSHGTFIPEKFMESHSTY